jgi:Fe-S oxidoreductase
MFKGYATMVLETRPANSMQEVRNNQTPGKNEPSAEGGLTFSAEQREKIAASLSTLTTWRTLSLLYSCVNCGLCTDACHYYKATNDPALIPITKMKKLLRLIKKCRVTWNSKLPFLPKSSPLSTKEIADLFRTVYEDCTLCGRCGMACPSGINAGPIFHTVRSIFACMGKAPVGLEKPVSTALSKWNYLGLDVDDLSETLEWMAEELADELKIEDFTIPIDQEGAETLYIPHPLEVRDYPLLLTAAVKILHAADEKYTFSTIHFDTVNYAYYSGHIENMITIVKHLLHAKEQVRAKNVVLAPCGHAYRVLRWEAERNLGYRFQFKVFTFSELIDRFLREGRIKIKKDSIDVPITYHDPCNIARYGGVIEQPRNILMALSSNFVEMEPHGALNYCCGGGGGLSASGDYGQLRIQIGKVKVEQIKKTGAKVIVTNCYNCHTQLIELNEKYKLGLQVKSIVELVADSLEVSGKKK